MAFLDRKQNETLSTLPAEPRMSVYIRWPGDDRYHRGDAVHVSAHGAFIHLERLATSIPRTIELVFVLPNGAVSTLRRVSALVAGASTHEMPTIFCSFRQSASRRSSA